MVFPEPKKRYKNNFLKQITLKLHCLFGSGQFLVPITASFLSAFLHPKTVIVLFHPICCSSSFYIAPLEPYFYSCTIKKAFKVVSPLFWVFIGLLYAVVVVRLY